MMKMSEKKRDQKTRVSALGGPHLSVLLQAERIAWSEVNLAGSAWKGSS